jgi:hypothetical protein
VTLLFLILLRPALQAAEGGSRNPLHWLALVVAFLLDVILAHTTWALVAGWPRKGEWTISHTLERLCKTTGPDRDLYIQIAMRINRESPTGAHIKAVRW